MDSPKGIVMKVLHVIDSGGLYGAETMLLNLMAEQFLQGLTPVLASIGVKSIIEKPIEKAAADQGVKVEKFRMTPGLNYHGAMRIVKFARAEKCDLLHTHGYKGNILLGLLPRPLRRMPIVSSLHGYTVVNGLSKMRLYEWLDAISMRFVDQVVLVNSAMRDHPRLKNIPVDFKVVNNGIPVSNGAPKAMKNIDPDILDFCRSGFTIGAVGRLSKEKGFDILLHAFSKAVVHNTDLKLIIIGEGKQRSILEEMIATLGISEKVMLTGFRPAAKNYFPTMKTLVIPSFTEGLPMVALEAMHAGLPIIATRVGGLPEVLEDGRAGMLVEKGSTEMLSRAIVKMANDPSLCKEYAYRGKKRVAENFSSAAMADSYLKIYNNFFCWN